MSKAALNGRKRLTNIGNPVNAAKLGWSRGQRYGKHKTSKSFYSNGRRGCGPSDICLTRFW